MNRRNPKAPSRTTSASPDQKDITVTARHEIIAIKCEQGTARVEMKNGSDVVELQFTPGPGNVNVHFSKLDAACKLIEVSGLDVRIENGVLCAQSRVIAPLDNDPSPPWVEPQAEEDDEDLAYFQGLAKKSLASR